jgi:3-oxoacyl-[acyl-carrier-protein] synthase-3
MILRFSDVYLEAIGYELPPNVVTSDDLERRLAPLYEALRLRKGQLEALTGIRERRFWDRGYNMSAGGAAAGRKALARSTVPVEQIDMLVYGGVCRDHLEPATACAVAHGLGLGPQSLVYDVSNACLGILNGIVQVASAIELGHIGAGLVVSCESARQIIDTTIARLLETKEMEIFKKTVATLTGGSGAAAVLLTHGRVSDRGHRLVGGAARNASAHHRLCTWGPDTGIPAGGEQVMETDSVGVLKNGVELGIATFAEFRRALQWPDGKPDKIVCHQVGATHQSHILDALGIPSERDFTTFRYLGNMGTVSLPLTAAIAAERRFLERGDLVGLLGIGSGLNCLMLGVEW